MLSLQVLSNAFLPFLGGRDIDLRLAEHFCECFALQYKLNVSRNSRAYQRLLGEVEKLKIQMSANPAKLQFNIECFMNDQDVRGEMSR